MNKKIVLQTLMAGACLCSSALALELNLSAISNAGNYSQVGTLVSASSASFSSRTGLSLGIAQPLFKTPFVGELNVDLLSEGTLSIAGSSYTEQLSVIPVELNVVWSSIPMFNLGAGINQSFWNSSTSPSVQFAGKLGYQIFAQSKISVSNATSVMLRGGFQANNGSWTISGVSADTNSQGYYLNAGLSYDFNS